MPYRPDHQERIAEYDKGVKFVGAHKLCTSGEWRGIYVFVQGLYVDKKQTYPLIWRDNKFKKASLSEAERKEAFEAAEQVGDATLYFAGVEAQPICPWTRHDAFAAAKAELAAVAVCIPRADHSRLDPGCSASSWTTMADSE